MLNLIPGIQSSVSALNAERLRMEAISENIANAHTTKDVNGKPFQRNIVVFENVLQQSMGSPSGLSGVGIAQIKKDNSSPQYVYQPGHPHADGQGMVAIPNINVYQEMADLISATRAFEANMAVVKSARSMAMQSLSIGKR